MYATRIGAEYKPHKTLNSAVAYFMRKVERTRQNAIAKSQNAPNIGWDIVNEETGETISLNDLMTETTPEIAEAMSDFQQNPRNAGRKPMAPETKKQRVGWSLPPEIIAAVKTHAEATNQSINEAAESLITAALNR